MKRITFDFIAGYNGKCDYRIYIDGRYDTLITARNADLTLAYADASPALQSDVDAFNAMLLAMFDTARAVYPETGPAPIYKAARQIEEVLI